MSSDYRALFRAVPSPVLVVAPDAPRFTITEVNEAYLHATLTEREGLIGRGIFEAFPDNPDDMSADGVNNLRASLMRVMSSGQADRMPRQRYDIRRPDGSFEERHWLPLNQPAFDESGKLSAIVYHVEDVTEAERKDARLRESEERFRTAADGSPALMWMSDADGAIIFANRRYRTFFGVDTDEMLGDGWRKIVHPDDVDAFHQAFREALARRAPAHLEVRVIHPLLGVRWLSCDGSPRLSPAGDFLGYVGVNIDITESKIAADALRATEGRLRAAVQASPFPMMLHAEDGEVLELSRKWTELTGYARGEIRTHFDWGRLAYPDSYSAFEQRIATEFRTEGEIAVGEVPVRTKDGSTRIWDFFNVGLGLLPDGRRLQISAATDVTERHRVEQELRQGEQRFRAAVKAVEGVLWTNNAAGEMEGEQPGWAALTGQTYDEYRGFGWSAAVHPEDAQKTLEAWTRAVSKRSTFEVEHRLRRADGEWRRYSVRAIPILNRGDEVVEWVGVHTDVTDQREAERAVRESETRFRNLADNAPMMVWVTDAAANCTYLSRSWYDFTGQSEQEGLGTGWLEAVHPEDRGWSGEIFFAANAKQEPFRLEYRLRGADGAYRWAIDAAAPRFDEDGSFLGYVGSVIDIDDRKLAEIALAESEARLRSLTDHLPGGVIYQVTSGASGEERRFVHMSQNFEKLTGVPAAAVLADPAAAYRTIHPDDRARIAASEADAVANVMTFDVEMRILKTDGEIRWCRTISTPRRQADGTVIWDGIQIDITDQKEAEDAIREQEARLRLALDAGRLAEVSFLISEDGVEHGPAFAMLLGYPPDHQLNLDDVRRAYHPEDRDRVLAERAAILAGDQDFYDVEKRVVWPDGQVRWVYGRGRVIRDSDGKAVLVRAVYIDDTERRAAQELVRKGEEQLRLITDALPVLISHMGPDLRYRFVNKAYETWFGIRREELIGTTVAEFVGEEAFARTETMIARALGGERVSFEQTMPYRRGGTRRVHIEFVPASAPDGSVDGYYALIQDVSEAHRAADALAEAYRKAEAESAERAAILGQLAEGVIVTDAAGRIIFVNAAAASLHGVDSLDIEPTDYASAYHLLREDGSAYPWEELPLARAVMHGETTTGERWRIRRPDGTEVLAIGGAQPILSAAGERLGAVLTLRDDTERFAAEQALQRLAETLEQRVAERTAELEAAHEQLRQSQKLEAMGQLTGGVAHDFNNLLTPIMGSLDMLQRRGVGSEREQRLIAGALQSADRARTLVQRLLAFARRQPLQPRAVDVGALVTGMADLVASTSGPKVKVVVDIEPELPPAHADANQLEMAILNLSVNARDAMPDGGMLTISARHVPPSATRPAKLPAGDYVRLSIADTGAGMDEETMARAIEPFFSTKGIGKGTGLGLSMVHGLASQLGGALTLASRPGLGTSAELWLPISQDGAVVAETGQVTRDDRRAGRALLVDDDEAVRASTAAMLADIGFDVVEAESAEEALRVLEQAGVPDILVTDHLMPGMSGTDLARKARSRWEGLPVLIVSGYSEVEDLAPDLPRLVKPFRQEELAASLAALGKSSEGATLPH